MIGSLADEIDEKVQKIKQENTSGDSMAIEQEIEEAIEVDGILMKKDNEYLMMNHDDLTKILGVSSR